MQGLGSFLSLSPCIESAGNSLPCVRGIGAVTVPSTPAVSAGNRPRWDGSRPLRRTAMHLRAEGGGYLTTPQVSEGTVPPEGTFGIIRYG